MNTLINTILKFYRTHKEPILYLFFGGLTTLVNLISYFLMTRLFPISEIPATILAWLLSVVFAYITNKIWVFESKCTSIAQLIKEIVSFFGARIFSGVLDVGIMYLFVSVLHYPDMLIKILSNIIVIILNYLFSKFFVFQKKHKNSSF